MAKKAFEELERATWNMSFPVMVALLGTIHNRLLENDELTDAADHVREAMSLLFEKHEESVVSTSSRRPH